MRWPLRRQIMLPMAAIMLATVLVLAAVGALFTVRATKSRIEAQIAGVMQILQTSNFPLTDAVLRQMKALSGADMAVVDDRGGIVSTSGSTRQFESLLATASQSEDGQFSLSERLWTRNRGYFHTVVPFTGRRGNDRSAMLHIFYPEAEYRRAWQHALYPSLAFTALALPMVMLIAGTTASRISLRMTRLQSQVDRIARGEFQQLSLAERDDEIRALGQAVNRMAAMLARYEEDVRRTERMLTLAHLGGGIAHQLRNSATGCRIALDLHAEDCATATSCESLSVAKRQLRLMEEYIQRFLQLGRPASGLGDEKIDLAELVDSLLPLVQPAARHARVVIEWQLPRDTFIVRGDSAALSQLIINLFINAVEAAAQKTVQIDSAGRVVVELERQSANSAVLTVSDSGSGPPSEIKDQLFEPFVTAKADGVGLGLSVANDVVMKHGGTIHWRRTGAMTEFTVELPCEQLEMQCA
jgi:signal transduction histidine kinase